MCFLRKITVGNSLEALRHASEEKSILIRNNLQSPAVYDKIKESWHKELFHLGLAGIDYYHGEISSIRINDDFIKVNSDLGNFKYEYEKCHIFDFENLIVEDNDLLKHDVGTHKTVDWFEVRKGADFSNLDIIEMTESFIKKIVFYKSGRVDHDLNFKDMVVISEIPSELVDDFDHSPTMVKFYCENYLTDMFSSSIKLEPITRDRSLLHKPKYKDSEKVRFIYD